MKYNTLTVTSIRSLHKIRVPISCTSTCADPGAAVDHAPLGTVPALICRALIGTMGREAAAASGDVDGALSWE